MIMKNTIRKKRTFLSLLLLLVFVFSVGLTGCGEDNADETATPAVKEDKAEHEKALKVENGTMTADATVIAVGQTPVTYSEYRTYYYFLNQQYDSLLGEQVWKQKVDSDKTIGQEAIEDVLRMIIQVKVIAKEAARQGVVLEADEKEDADYSAQQFFESLDEETTSGMMITAQQLMKIFEENRLAKKMYHVITGQADTGAAQGDTRAYRVQLLYKSAGDNRDQTREKMEKLQKKIATASRNFYGFA